MTRITYARIGAFSLGALIIGIPASILTHGGEPITIWTALNLPVLIVAFLRWRELGASEP